MLRHERIPFVSYPYEWAPGMLRDAALLQLDLLLAALDEDLTLKDATPYNVQFRGALPVFVDVGSFEQLREGEPWVGLPAVLRAVPLSAAARGLEGRAVPALAARLAGGHPAGGDARAAVAARPLPPRRAGHVFLHARLERSYGRSGRTGGDVKKELRSAGFGKEIVRANVRKMRKLVDGLSWKPPEGVWTAYRDDNTYTDADAAAKDAFVESVAAAAPAGAGVGSRLQRRALRRDRRPPCRARGRRRQPTRRRSSCSTAASARRAAPTSCRSRSTSSTRRPGWAGAAASAGGSRSAVVPTWCCASRCSHHVCITGNVPVAEYVAWLAELRRRWSSSWSRREDPMVRRLLAAKPEGTHPDYDEAFFERALGESFDVERREVLPSGMRVLYHARPR